MPGVLISHKTFFKSAFLQVANEVSVAPAPLLYAAPSSVCRRSVVDVTTRHAFPSRWIIRWAGLQTDWLTGIEMAGDSLNSGWDAALLLLHGRCALPHWSNTPLLVLIHIGLGHLRILALGHLLGLLGGGHLSILAMLLAIW